MTQVNPPKLPWKSTEMLFVRVSCLLHFQVAWNMSYIFWETVKTTYCTSIIGLLRYNLRTLVVYFRGQRNICFLWFFKESLMIHRRLSKDLCNFVALLLAGIRVALNYVAWHSLRLHLPSRAKISSHEVPGLPKFHFAELGVALLPSIGMRRGGQGAKVQLARQCSWKFHTESGENLLLPVSSSFPFFSQSLRPFSFFGLCFGPFFHRGIRTDDHIIYLWLRSAPRSLIFYRITSSYTWACICTRLTVRGFAQLRIIPLRQFDRVRSSKLPRNGAQNYRPRFTCKSREHGE